MKKTLLALALLAASTGAFAQTTPKAVAKVTAKRADGCTGMAAAKCDKSMASGAMGSTADMPACCRAKMAAAKATPTATASAAKPVVKSL